MLFANRLFFAFALTLSVVACTSEKVGFHSNTAAAAEFTSPQKPNRAEGTTVMNRKYITAHQSGDRTYQVMAQEIALNGRGDKIATVNALTKVMEDALNNDQLTEGDRAVQIHYIGFRNYLLLLQLPKEAASDAAAKTLEMMVVTEAMDFGALGYLFLHARTQLSPQQQESYQTYIATGAKEALLAVPSPEDNYTVILQASAREAQRHLATLR